MKSTMLLLMTVLIISLCGCACQEEATSDRGLAGGEQTLVGQILLPAGIGSRGVELMVEITERGGEPSVTWVLFDTEGHFSHVFRGALTKIQIAPGIGQEVFLQDDPGELQANQAGQIDLGIIDLRDHLVEHSFVVGAKTGKTQGEVRVAMWLGRPPVGPFGEPPSLGSGQFPPVTLGKTSTWLLPPEAQNLYFLMERPIGPGRGREWRSGPQQLFGPFTAKNLPAALIMD